MAFPLFLDLLECTHQQPFETLENHINPQVSVRTSVTVS